jgi:hypothetical protein
MFLLQIINKEVMKSIPNHSSNLNKFLESFRIIKIILMEVIKLNPPTPNTNTSDEIS